MLEQKNLVKATHGRIKVRDGQELYYEAYESSQEPNSGDWVIVTHGIGEYLERHYYLLDLLKGYNVLFYDLRGHGESSGQRGYVEHFEFFIDDFKEINQFLFKQFKVKRLFLFGHSMGALITWAYLQKHSKNIPCPDQVFLSGPPVSVPGIKGILTHKKNPIAKILNGLPYGFYMPTPVFDNQLSHEREVFKDYLNNPKILKKFHTNVLVGLIYSAQKYFSGQLKLETKVHVAIASCDKLICPKKALDYFQKVQVARSILAVPFAYHEMHNELESYRTTYFSYIKSCFKVQ